ncbi:MAG: TRAP transporter large permease subunit [Arenicellales bacterium]|nr:TRAP transporter large permease subunit [Arenicellales bacterium]
MELVFLSLLIALMVLALSSGFPVAFSLPGSAILSIGAAALCGYIFAGDAGAYFAQGGAVQWLSAGVTNFRSLYWDVERDTLIAIPLFIFMGIMLQRSKIAEDLLVAMAQLFGPVPGGLGISVVFVGTLLAATTGIVGATVIAMGLISLPAMLRHNYAKPLACGTICAAGTLGQIIPPSIVLIILADQLSNATDVAGALRTEHYKQVTGEFNLPSEFSVSSASAGEMFMGALFPGLVLVGLYMGYILIRALIQPRSAPSVPYEGKYDLQFIFRVVLALVPPLALIFAVLGSIIMGIATVNQAGAIGAIGAMIMGGYRLNTSGRHRYLPAIIALVSTLLIFVVNSTYEVNVKNLQSSKDVVGLILASVGVAGLLVSMLWSAHRAFVTEDVLRGVMVETAKITSMVFIILIGAAMLTSAFRAFGGEILVKDFLGGLPGGFWMQFIVVMAVIFLLGFFLDFIEIAVVVVPIVAPILLAEPSANVTAVWLGVMIGLNIQTSFLTPPFGFALFYLRGVAPSTVKTLQIYRGAVAFIALQLAGLAITGYLPSLVNYLPNKITLTAETAPPPMNPRLQECLETYVFTRYDESEDTLRAAVRTMRALDMSFLPQAQAAALEKTHAGVLNTFALITELQRTRAAVGQFEPGYRPLHRKTRFIQRQMRKVDKKIEELEQEKNRISRGEGTEADLLAIDRKIAALVQEKQQIAATIPVDWEGQHEAYVTLVKQEKKAVIAYRRNVDESYDALVQVRQLLAATPALIDIGPALAGLREVIINEAPDTAMPTIKALGKELGSIAGSSKIKSRISKARRALKGSNADPVKALALLDEGLALYADEVRWRQKASQELGGPLTEYDQALKRTVGLRLQERLDAEQAEFVARCKSKHQDISLNF